MARALITALHEALLGAGEAAGPGGPVDRFLRRTCAVPGWPVAQAFGRASGAVGAELVACAWQCANPARFEAFERACAAARVREGAGPAGEACRTLQAAAFTDLGVLAEPERARAAVESGLRAAVVLPVPVRGRCEWLIELFADRPAGIGREELDALTLIGRHLGLALEQDAALEELRASEERYRVLAAAANDAILSIDARSTILFANPAAARIFGYPLEELIGMPLMRLMPERMRGRHLEGLRCYLETGKRAIRWGGTELVALRRDGTELPIEIAFGDHVTASGRVFTGIARDITERKRAEEEHAKLEEQLLQARKMESVGRLAGGVAHDFNNVLSVILGYGDALRRELEPSDHRLAYVEECLSAAQRASNLTRQLLAFSRKQVVAPVVVDLNALIGSMDELCRRLVGEDIVWETRLPPGLGHVRVDPGQVEQVVMNLVANARDAMAQGGRLVVETANVVLDEHQSEQSAGAGPGTHVVLSVTDTGIGMDRETLSRIFEPFFTTKARGKGTGLGLSTVYGIVEQSGGALVVDSEPGRGSTFKVYFPRVTEPLPPVKVERTGDGHGNEIVLLVEDDHAIRALIRSMLERWGYSVIDAGDPRDALELCEHRVEPLDLVVTDVVMPGMSGKSMVELLRQRRPTLPVLYISGYTDSSIDRHGVLEPGIAFLQKPFAPAELQRKVREVIEAARA